MQVKLFKFYIRYYDTGISAYRYLYITSAGAVSTTTTKTELPQAPKGWEELELKWERGFTLHGVFTNYTSPLNFVLDGAKILRYYYYNAGIEANLELFIEKHTNIVSTWGYAPYYIGDIDFSQFKDAKDFVTISIMDSGFIKNLKAKEESTLEIPVDGNADAIYIMMDGIDLEANVDLTSIDQPRFPNGAMDSVSDSNGGLGILRVVLPTLLRYGAIIGYGNGDIYVKGNDYLGINKYPAVSNNTGTFDVTVLPYYVLHNTSQTLTYQIDVVGQLYMSSVNNSGGAGDIITPQVRAWVVLAGAVTSTPLLATGTAINPSFGVHQAQKIEINSTVTVAPNEFLYIYVEHTHTNLPIMDSLMHFYKCDLSIQWLNKVPTSYIPVLPMTTVGDALVANIDSTYTLNSQPMVDKEDDYFLTSGDAIRGLADSQLKTTFSDFYKAMDNMFMTAFYYDKSTLDCYIDYRANCYDSGTLTMSLGEVAKMNVAPLTQEMFSKLRIGYKPYSYDEINGKEEFNTEYEFQSPITRVTTEKNLVSSYRADMYGIELTRTNLDDKVLADSDMDNDIFWIHVDKSIRGTIPAGYPNAGATYYGLYRDPSIITQGLISPSTAFNIEFSPKRRMNVHGAWLKATTHPSNYLDLKFNTSSKTTNTGVGLGTDDAGLIIIEKQDETINSLDGTIMLFPIVFTIEVKTPINILDLLTNVPHGYIEFEWLGNPYSGYILEVSDMPTYTPKQTFKLIAQAGIDLTPLIV